MSMRDFELGGRRHRPTPVSGRDLAAAWLTAAAVIAALLVVPGMRGAEHLPGDSALAAAVTKGHCLAPNGIGGTHQGIETCSARDWADERC